ncbi:hypothetical protein ENBRE01_2158 [Enteropsectra breve]|nr:hypothetical protein ENBRE01_2158 [Enteropsectra breve]
MNKDTMIGYKADSRPYNSDSFSIFESKLIKDLVSNGVRGGVFVMDNVSFHKVRAIRMYAQDHEFDFLFLPSYSPFLNPIENMFSKWKQAVRVCNSQNEEELMHIIENVAHYFTTEDCASFYRHMFTYIPRCLRDEIITD